MDVFKGRGGFKGVGHHARKDDNVLADLDLIVQGIEEGFEVLGVLVRINGYDDLEEHHLACTKQTEGRFPPLPRIALFGGHDGEVVKTRFEWKMNALDIAVLELEHGRELASDSFAKEPVFHGRQPYDGGGEDGVLSARDGGDVQHGVLTGERIEAVVIAKGPFEFGFGWVAIAFDDDVGLSGHPEVLREGFGDGKGFLTEDAGKLVL